MKDFDPSDQEPTKPDDGRLSGKGVVIRCSWCMREQRIDMGAVYPDRQSAELYLTLITGGWSGKANIGYRPVSEDDRQRYGSNCVGMSACCGKQIEGETFGYGGDQ